MADEYDIVVAGGGMVGISLALKLGEALPDDTRILLSDLCIRGSLFKGLVQSPILAELAMPADDSCQAVLVMLTHIR